MGANIYLYGLLLLCFLPPREKQAGPDIPALEASQLRASEDECEAYGCITRRISQTNTHVSEGGCWALKLQ